MLHRHGDLGVLKSLKAVDPLELSLAQHGVQTAGPQRRISVAERLHEGAHRLVTPAEIPHVEHDAKGVDLKEADLQRVPKTLAGDHGCPRACCWLGIHGCCPIGRLATRARSMASPSGR